MPKAIYTNDEIVTKLRRARDIADRVRSMIHARALQASIEAGTGEYLGTTLHNALISFEEGKPWREVNYAKARLARHLCERSYEPSRIVDKFYRRMVGLLPH